ncbi:hypothetical protein [Mesobacterium pallidum]|uniref:hypothetical protein n=1 Tax=Mesobacterium pallidum TaxID=2872037 RepID=UPI001EE3014F|nr:hypothetical protein [Mesobacterium pallidum]
MKLITLALALCVSAAPALAENWLCKMNQPNPQDWFGTEVFVGVDDDSGRAVAANAAALGFMGGPVPFKVNKNTDKVLKGEFLLDRIEDSLGQKAPAMRYGLVIQKASGTLSMNVRASGYQNAFYRDGKCARVTGEPKLRG